MPYGSNPLYHKLSSFTPPATVSYRMALSRPRSAWVGPSLESVAKHRLERRCRFGFASDGHATEFPRLDASGKRSAARVSSVIRIRARARAASSKAWRSCCKARFSCVSVTPPWPTHFYPVGLPAIGETRSARFPRIRRSPRSSSVRRRNAERLHLGADLRRPAAFWRTARGLDRHADLSRVLHDIAGNDEHFEPITRSMQHAW